MTSFEIPLISMPQKFEITLAGVAYNLTVRWIDAGQFWSLDVADQSGASIISGMPLITGGDMLAPYAYLDLGGQLQVFTDTDTDAAPTSSNLGSQSHLLFVTL